MCEKGKLMTLQFILVTENKVGEKLINFEKLFRDKF